VKLLSEQAARLKQFAGEGESALLIIPMPPGTL